MKLQKREKTFKNKEGIEVKYKEYYIVLSVEGKPFEVVVYVPKEYRKLLSMAEF